MGEAKTPGAKPSKRGSAERSDFQNVIRVGIFCCLGVSLPVVFAVVLAPMIFSKQQPFEHEYSRQRLAAGSGVEAPVVLEPPALLERDRFSEIVHARHVDPTGDSVFVVSAKVRFAKLPDVGQRERIFFKYAVRESPYAGWALALKRWATTMRPEVYWRDAAGNGGWYTFGELNVSQGQWYTFTFIAENDEALSMYVSPDGDSAAEAGSDPEGLSHFLGGVSLEKVSLPRSSDSLYLAPVSRNALAAQQDSVQHPVEIDEFVIAELTPERYASLKARLKGRVQQLQGTLEAAEIKLRVSPENMRDQRLPMSAS